MTSKLKFIERRLYGLIPLICLLFIACNKSKHVKENEWYNLYLEKILQDEQESASKLLILDIKKGIIPKADSTPFLPYLAKLYENDRNLWSNGIIPNSQADSFIEIIQNANYYGFDSNYFNYERLKLLYDSAKNTKSDKKLLSVLDLNFSNEAIRFVTYNKYGFSNRLKKDSASIKGKMDTLSIEEIDMLRNGITENKVKESIDKIIPKNPFYLRLQKGLEKFITKHPISNKKIKVASMKEDSVKSYESARLALLSYAYLDSNNYKDDSALMKKIRFFQKQHGLTNDGKIGRATAHMLSQSNEERYQKAAVSLEKLRHKNFDSTNYFLVNIPAFKLNIVENHKIIKHHRVVVGKNSTKTPTFDASMQYMILNPHWAIPYSISSKEILPQIKKNVSIIEKKGYTIMDNNRKRVNLDSVDWSSINSKNFNFRITQTRSGRTALGKVKFIFPNNHSIYFHDTPSKSLFQNDVRAYSHGCVRVHEPLKLAEYILQKQDPNMNYDTIKRMTNSSLQKKFNLKKDIAVHIDYYTSFVDEEDNIQFYRDIYDRDKVYKKLLFSKK